MRLYSMLSLSLLFISTSLFAQNRSMNVEHLSSGMSYFNVEVSDSGLLKGKYPGWCADWSFPIEDGVQYNTHFWSSLASNIPGDVVDKPENLDEVNWLINQKFVGKNSPTGLGKYTIGDVQLAIWTLIDDNFDDSTIGDYSQARVDELVDRALRDGANYVPNCRQLVGVILVPTHPESGNRAQSTIILVPRYKFRKCVVPDNDLNL
ncbi:MAG: hypothetical protein WDA09_00105 [Bacteriovoracaceae bacterium]